MVTYHQVYLLGMVSDFLGMVSDFVLGSYVLSSKPKTKSDLAPRELGKGALDYLQSHPFCKKETLGS